MFALVQLAAMLRITDFNIKLGRENVSFNRLAKVSLVMLIPSELALSDVYFSPWLVCGTLGFLLAWMTGLWLNKMCWSRYVSHPPLVSIAMSVIYTVIISMLLIPA